jgi:LPS sulfotransferase NodH
MKYIIFFQPRSGSTYIASRLNDVDGDVLNGFEIADRETARWHELLDDTEYERFSAPIKKEVLRRFFAKYSDRSIVGCKIAPYQVADDLPGVFQFALKQVDKCIFLVRENPVQVAISQIWSLERARQNEPAWLVEGEENSVRTLEIEKGEFEYYVISSVVERDLVLSLSKIPGEALRVTYEEFFVSPSRSFDRVRKFLEIPDSVRLPESNLVRIRKETAKSYIRNYDEVRKWVGELGLDSSLLDAQL